MKPSINQISVKSSCLPSAISSINEVEGVETLSLRKKLLAAFASVLNKLNGAAIEGICGPGAYYGTSMAEAISRRSIETNG